MSAITGIDGLKPTLDIIQWSRAIANKIIMWMGIN